MFCLKNQIKASIGAGVAGSELLGFNLVLLGYSIHEKMPTQWNIRKH
jgi:hypothetical protein